jgi:hypothetical protein
MRFHIAILFLLFTTLSFSQRQNVLSRSELGIIAGGMYYIGDLNSFQHFQLTQPAGGIFYKFNINGRLAFRIEGAYGSVKADDQLSKDATLKNRNLNFTTTIKEIGLGMEFNYFPFQIGNKHYRGTGYIFAEIAYFQMDPSTTYEGQTYQLRTLGTEGQNTSLNSQKYYSQNQLALPIGIGFKYPIAKRLCIGTEYGIRYLFTDYLDDVASDRYVDAGKLAVESSKLAAKLSNRSLDQNPYGMRGSSSTRDWYFFFGLTLSMNLGNPDECFRH